MDFDIGSEEHMKAMWAGQSNVLVAVRVRPLMKHDIIKRRIRIFLMIGYNDS